MERHFNVPEGIDVKELFGNLDRNLRILKESTGVDVVQRGSELVLIKDRLESDPDRDVEADLDVAERVMNEYVEQLLQGAPIDSQKASYIVALAKDGLSYRESKVGNDVICFTHSGKPLKPKTLGQKEYAKAMREKEVVFGIGPAGTGKTYLAVAMACSALKQKMVEKIVLTRPAVEAGERLGFLPGDLQEKVDPYLRPLYDALYDVLGRDQALRLKERETIEIVPLAYMRGRTLDNAFIILDEAQNTTKEQMKMFLTRMGFGSRMVITGDKTQIDLPRGKRSGLLEAEKVLRSVGDISFCYLKDTDVVRHELVSKIVNAYDMYYKKHPEEEEES